MKENKIGGLPMAEHILVGLSSAPSNARIIRTAATMAKAFGGTFTALFVRTPNYEAMSEENKERLRQNTALAQELGATIETVFGDDVSYQIAEYLLPWKRRNLQVGMNYSRTKCGSSWILCSAEWQGRFC